MEGAWVRLGSRGRTEKEKSSENKTTPGQEAIYFTDTVDLHLLSVNKHAAPTQDNPGALLLVSG